MSIFFLLPKHPQKPRDINITSKRVFSFFSPAPKMCSVISRNVFSAGRFLYRSSYAYTCKVLEFSQITSRRTYSSDETSKKNLSEENEVDREEGNLLSPAVRSNFQPFREEDAPVIFDVDEEKKRLDLEAFNAMQDVHDPYEGLNMKRGVDGVFEIEDLVDLLRKDKAQNIFVATVPKELSYVDYLVIVTGKSPRHMIALATFVRKAYKLKRNDEDIIPKVEGANSKDWIALDLGNIALHIFSKSARELYDLETLWAVGAEYDNQLNQADSEEEFEDRYMKFLEGLQPADEPETPPVSTLLMKSV
ncbi:uncharacterized protein LOC107047908 [Diachasma alloeum]|uniref:uncharacterized protein LOC107047908 n=1 Tax=Diachasma alloeum TaxID=454923 RepID=UPI00073830E0|nr:uncharacterized protein LOC107047908 [Diachasma alloeum]